MDSYTGLVGDWQRMGPMSDGDLLLLQNCCPLSRLVVQPDGAPVLRSGAEMSSEMARDWTLIV